MWLIYILLPFEFHFIVISGSGEEDDYKIPLKQAKSNMAAKPRDLDKRILAYRHNSIPFTCRRSFIKLGLIVLILGT